MNLSEHQYTLLLTCVLAPLVGCILAYLLSFLSEKLAPVLSVIALAVSCVSSILLILDSQHNLIVDLSIYRWLHIGSYHADITWHIDAFSRLLLVVISTVGLCVSVYSTSYVGPKYPRGKYFGLLCLFVFSMYLLILSDDLIIMLFGWEGVGVCSYMLVGFYSSKESARNAAQKALLVTRLGDMAMIYGMILLWQNIGFTTSIQEILSRLQDAELGNSQITWAAILMVCGAIGKSAQFPLHVWLPDAMEGPTPVSALIHAATMVTAGVYLIARMPTLFAYDPVVQKFIVAVGAITALLAALCAIAQHDIKKVLAYSTISQLGYMFMALGCINLVEDGEAESAAIFHLFTHAFFKALLFLAAGNVMYAMSGMISVKQVGGLKAVLPFSRILFVIGALALAGIPPFAGFWSKDEILEVVTESAQVTGSSLYWGCAIAGYLTVLLTAYYITRCYILSFEGELRPKTEETQPKSCTWLMLAPMVLLAVGAVIAGLLPLVYNDGHHSILNNIHGHSHDHDTEHAHSFWPMFIGLMMGVSGIVLAIVMTDPANPSIYSPAISENSFYIDEIYRLAVVVPLNLLAILTYFADRILGGLTIVAAKLLGLSATSISNNNYSSTNYYSVATLIGIASVALLLLYLVAS